MFWGFFYQQYTTKLDNCTSDDKLVWVPCEQVFKGVEEPKGEVICKAAFRSCSMVQPNVRGGGGLTIPHLPFHRSALLVAEICNQVQTRYWSETQQRKESSGCLSECLIRRFYFLDPLFLSILLFHVNFTLSSHFPLCTRHSLIPGHHPLL